MVLTIYFRLLSSPLLSLFLPHYFFLFGWAFSGFNLVGKVFGKALRILRSDERKGRWVLEQDFHGNFRAPVSGQCYMFFLPFCPASFTESCSLHSGMVWKISLVSGQSCPWPLKMMTLPAIEETWIRTGGYGRLRDELVYTITFISFNVFVPSGEERGETAV